jgi:O-antigen/teichoic acid export membrane protein
MGFIQKDALLATIITYIGIVLGYLNRGVLFLILFTSQQIGLISLITTIGLLFAQLTNLGSIYITWRFFPFFRNAERKHYGFLLMNCLIILVGISIFSSIYVIFKPEIAQFYSKKSVEFLDYYFWIIPVGIANVFFMIFDYYLRGLHKNIVSVFLQEIVLRCVTLTLLCLFAFKLISFDQFLVYNLLGYFVPTLILLIYLIRIGEFNLSFRSITIPKRFRKILLNFSLFSYINTLTTLMVISLDTIMIASYLGLTATGVYTNIIYLTSAIQVPYRSVVRVSSPLIAKYWKERNISEIQKLYQKVSSLGILIGTFSFSIIWINRTELFSFLPPEYQAGILVFLFLMIGRMVDMVGGLNGTIFSTSRKYRYDLLFSILLSFTVFGLNYLLIPTYGIVGAAVSTGFAYVIYNIGRIWYIYYSFQIHPFTKQLWYLLILFTGLILINELVFMQLDWPNKLISISVKTIFFMLGFILPVFIFRLEPESIAYAQKWKRRLLKKRSSVK